MAGLQRGCEEGMAHFSVESDSKEVVLCTLGKHYVPRDEQETFHRMEDFRECSFAIVNYIHREANDVSNSLACWALRFGRSQFFPGSDHIVDIAKALCRLDAAGVPYLRTNQHWSFPGQCCRGCVRCFRAELAHDEAGGAVEGGR